MVDADGTQADGFGPRETPRDAATWNPLVLQLRSVSAGVVDGLLYRYHVLGGRRVTLPLPHEKLDPLHSIPSGWVEVLIPGGCPALIQQHVVYAIRRMPLPGAPRWEPGASPLRSIFPGLDEPMERFEVRDVRQQPVQGPEVLSPGSRGRTLDGTLPARGTFPATATRRHPPGSSVSVAVYGRFPPVHEGWPPEYRGWSFGPKGYPGRWMASDGPVFSLVLLNACPPPSVHSARQFGDRRVSVVRPFSTFITSSWMASYLGHPLPAS